MPRKRDLGQIDRVIKKIGLTRGQRELLHRAISKKHLSLDEIKELAKQIKEIYPNK
jgi:hypothetical protein